MKWLVVFMGALGILPQAHAVIGACGGRSLPSSEDRQAHNIHLECSSNADHYIRRTVSFDYKAWTDLESEKDRDGMQRLRQQEPLIQWGGTIPYSTIEVWDWVDWVYGPDSSCGYDHICTTQTRSDGKGGTETYESCTDVMRSCWHDEPRHSERYCSTETMEYKAQFIRPSLAEWNPRTPGYYDILPNKYDLLPAEVEDVQIFTNPGQRSSVSPTYEIGDAWNEYKARLTIAETRSNSAYCLMNQTYHLNVEIFTERRIPNKQTPNGFRVPVNANGKQISPLRWSETADGKSRTIPNQVRLTDVSQVLITALARQSRKFDSERTKLRLEHGEGQNTTAEEADKATKASGFWKNTKVRVRLFQEIKWGRDIRVTHNLYTSGSDVAFGDRYEIPLDGNDTDHDLYRPSGLFNNSGWDWFNVNLKPGKKYYLLVSMYQEGVPFYAQDKSSFWQRENSFYSKELPLSFIAPENYEARSFGEKVLNWIGEKF